MKKFIFAFITLCSLQSFAQRSSRPQFTYDISGGVGSYDSNSYTQLQLGLNWYAYEWLNWRNAAFTQFGSSINNVYGLDSSILFQTSAYTQNRDAGVEVFLGPGVRLASENSNAGFAQGGITFALGGLRLGFGAQALHYWAERTDKNDVVMPKDEVNYFITVSGGGSF
ncbi:hypothetical protein D3C72_1033260 [compost metagenome]